MRGRLLILATCLFAGATVTPASANRISHPTAVFAGLDKITGRIIAFEAAIGETVQFGSLQITPRVCFTRPATEAPLTTGFVEVEEVNVNNEYKRIFGGWMFAASPGLHAVEHPVYDAWLTDCKGGKEIIPDAVARAPASASPAGVAAPPPAAAQQPPARRQPTQQQAAPSAPAAPSGAAPQQAGRPTELGRPVDIAPPPGGAPRPPGSIPREPERRAPSQSFFPDTPAAPSRPASTPPRQPAPFGVY